MSNHVEMQTRIRIIAAQLEKGLSSSDIAREFSSQWNVTERTIERYIAIAKDIVIERMDNLDAIIEAVRGAVIAEEAEKQLRSNLELEARLISIIEGEMELEKVSSRSDGITEVRSKPTRKEVMRAIEILWRKRGLYQKAKEDPKNENLSRLPEIRVENEEEKKLLEQTFKLP